jgi:hypothetical protein
LQFWIFKFRIMVVPTDFRCLLTLPRSPHNFPFLTNFLNSCLIMVHTRRSPLSQPSTVVTRSAKVSILFALVSKNEDGRYSYEVCRACALSHFPMLCRIFFSLLMTMLVSSPLFRPLEMRKIFDKALENEKMRMHDKPHKNTCRPHSWTLMQIK